MVVLDFVFQYPISWFYNLVLWRSKSLCPPPSFTIRDGTHLDEIGVQPFEEALERLESGKTFLFDGTTTDGNSIIIHITLLETYFLATLQIVIDDVDYRTQLRGLYDTEDGSLRASGLLIEVREEFRRWRISYKGQMRNVEADEDSFVTFSGWWKPLSDARYTYSNISGSAVVPPDSTVIYDLVHAADIIQFGQLLLEVSTNGEEPRPIRFRGSRQIVPTNFHESIKEFSVYFENAQRIFYRLSNLKDSVSQVGHGVLFRADAKARALNLCDKSSLALLSYADIEFEPGRMKTIKIVKKEVLETYIYQQDSKTVEVTRIKVQYENYTGIAFLRTVTNSNCNPLESNKSSMIHHPVSPTLEQYSEVLSFSEKQCQNKSLSGGKGANLAMLKEVQKEYTVPVGVVVSTMAFDNHVRRNPAIQEAIQKLPSPGLSVEEYVSLGEEIQGLIRKTSIDEELQIKISKLINQDNSVNFAVRSSAVGEDGSDLSSAGQLESLLNVTHENICKSVIECWCSNFREEVISYRRNYGQILNPSMAVVIQEMVNDGVAGVMFTCDPVKNDDGVMVINAIKGMGEDIVSGVVTPDEIRVVKKTNLIKPVIIKPSNCCLSDEAIYKLISVGTYLGEKFGSEQDIEFVIKDSDVYLVQSRNVTGRDRESQFELKTEFEDGTLTDREIFSTANVGEVAGFAQSPWEISQGSEQLSRITSYMVMNFITPYLPRHIRVSFHTQSQRYLFNIGEMLLRSHEALKKERLLEVSFGGQLMLTEEMFQMGFDRFDPLPKIFPLKRMCTMLKEMFIDSHRIKGIIEKKQEELLELTPSDDSSIEDIFVVVEKQKILLAKILQLHTQASTFSQVTYLIVGMLIRGSTDGSELTQELLSDLARIFSSNVSAHVVSADIPSSLRELTDCIIEDGLRHKFLISDDLEAINILKTAGRESKKQLEYFLETHGHRGPNELSMRAKGWGDAPETLVSTLKLMIQSPRDRKKTLTTDEILDSLSCRPQGLRRWLMKYLVGETHRGVASREHAKNIVVRSSYECRKTLRRLASELCKKGFIPDEDLLLFFTRPEIERVYKTRSAKLISRAMRRRQIFPELETHQFQHIYWGNPEPINLKANEELASLLSLTGTVVCEGKVVALARVAHNLEEAKYTQPGEVLITKCTDICWSPYFPIIKGIVTEIGGLLSHGAVVAREYGLPCLIAVEHATQVFKTGDLVELNTYQGKISKLEQ